MKISQKWLFKILNIKDFDVNIFIKKMIMSGFNVEKYYKFSNIEKIYTGKIINIEQINNKLFKYNIEVFKNYKPYQFISRYKNFNIGDIVPIALEDSIINDNIIVKKIYINNEISDGIICNIYDLGLSDIDSIEFNLINKVIIFDSKLEIGENVKQILCIDDIIFDIEITNNRNDCQTAHGLAMEIASIFDIKLKPNDKFIIDNHLISNNIFIFDKLINRYIHSFNYQIISFEKNFYSPRWLRNMLNAVDFEYTNIFLLDIIKYLKYYYGYDIYLLKIKKDKKIKVKFIENSINFFDINNKEILAYSKISSNDIELNNNEIFVLVNINLNYAFFENNKKYLKNHILNKTLHNSYYNRNYEEFISLLNSLLTDNNIKIIDQFYYKKICNKINKISLNFNKINKILGHNIDINNMIKIFQRLYFQYNKINNTLLVPKYRTDIKTINDISEEVARIYGYDNFLKDDSNIINSKDEFYQKYKFKYNICKLCRHLGFNEIMTLPFLNYKYNEILDIFIEESKLIYLKNPINDDNKCMRHTIVPSLFGTFNNIINKNKNELVNIYELGKVYIYSDNKYNEINKLCLLTNNINNILDFKEKILTILKNIDNINFIQSNNLSWLHPYQQANIYSNDVQIGYIGKLNPKILFKLNINNQNIYIAEIYFDKLYLLKNNNKKYVKFSKFPSIIRDLSLICDKNIPSINIKKLIINADDKHLIKEIELFDFYINENKFGKNKICLNFTLTFIDDNQTLTDFTVNKIINNILSSLNSTYKIKLRDI